MPATKSRAALIARQFALMTLGCFIYSIGQVVFIRPMLIPMGGVTGIALIVNYLAGLPVGVVNLVLNIPLLALGYKALGREFFAKTVFGTVVISVMMDVVGPALAALNFAYKVEDYLLSALAGGAIMGAGIGIIFLQGGTAGGTDIIAKYINKKRDMPVGNVSLYINTVVLALGAVVFRSLESGLYAMITIYISNTMVDRIVYGGDVQKQATIITTRPTEVADAIMARLGRGVTAWDGRGMYTGEARTVLMCAVHRYESGVLKSVLSQADPQAVMMLGEVNEVFGRGFKKLER